MICMLENGFMKYAVKHQADASRLCKLDQCLILLAGNGWFSYKEQKQMSHFVQQGEKYIAL